MKQSVREVIHLLVGFALGIILMILVNEKEPVILIEMIREMIKLNEKEKKMLLDKI